MNLRPSHFFDVLFFHLSSSKGVNYIIPKSCPRSLTRWGPSRVSDYLPAAALIALTGVVAIMVLCPDYAGHNIATRPTPSHRHRRNLGTPIKDPSAPTFTGVLGNYPQ